MDKLINKANLERMIIALNERYEELVDNEKARAQSKEEEIAARAEEAINMFGGKSIVYISKEEYDNLDEAAKNDDTVTYFITDAEDDFQSREDGNLVTEDKTIVGAINELHNMLGGKSIIYISKEEYDDLDETAKNDDTVTYFITDAEDDFQSREDGNLVTEDKTIVGAINELHHELSVVDALKLNGYSLWVGTSTELDAIETKDPDTLYFEIDDKTEATVDVVQVECVDGMLQLTTDKYQKTDMVDGTEIFLPEVDEFTEIHLYFNSVSIDSLILNNCKWRIDHNIEEATAFELVATYNTIQWLVNILCYS